MIDLTQLITAAQKADAAIVSDKQAKLSAIRAVEDKQDVSDAFIRATRQLLLSTWFEKVKAKPAAANLTDVQIDAWCRTADKTYKALADAEDAIKVLRAKV